MPNQVTRQRHSLTIGRFVFSPIAEVDERLSSETSELKSDVENLGKKLQYLETTHKNSREHIDQIFKSRA
jgi:prefoldin subunit 1